MLVREAQQHDFNDLLSLISVFPHQDHKQDEELIAQRFHEILEDRRMHLLVSEAEGSVVSTCTLVILPNMTRRGRPYGLVEVVATKPEFRRKGAATAVLSEALQRAWRADCYKVMLHSGKRNLEAHKFYQQCGFEESRLGFQMENPSLI
ncbi:GNAT family N-acetyltransferase [Maritalea porphyrae]|uniref:GNAT family N-acetyltransferase n=1 Tax=Maritalea porphyrae TaxID=880732 RepID=UPI0024E097BF|nr:GNAT family N-acetyltransferase [Maritalea porphyrae]